MVNFDLLIKDEEEAIDGYKKEMAKTDDVHLIELFEHIISEEQEHIKELQEAKSNIKDPVESKSILDKAIRSCDETKITYFKSYQDALNYCNKNRIDIKEIQGENDNFHVEEEVKKKEKLMVYEFSCDVWENVGKIQYFVRSAKFTYHKRDINEARKYYNGVVSKEKRNYSCNNVKFIKSRELNEI